MTIITSIQGTPSYMIGTSDSAKIQNLSSEFYTKLDFEGLEGKESVSSLASYATECSNSTV